MLTTTRAEYVYSERQDRYILVYDNSIIWTGAVALCKGTTAAQNSIANNQQQFYSTLTNDYNTQFANQSNILGSLNSSLSPIVNAGVGQYGFGNAEDAAMRTQATGGTAAAYQSAKRAVGENQAASGGGNEFVGSGVNAQNQTALANSAASTVANQNLGITQAGYQQGRQNYMGAVGAEQGVASQYNPTGYAGSANNAGSSAMSSADTIQQVNAANNPWTILGGALGGPLSQLAGNLAGGVPGSGGPSANGPDTSYGMNLAQTGNGAGPLGTTQSSETDELLPLLAM